MAKLHGYLVHLYSPYKLSHTVLSEWGRNKYNNKTHVHIIIAEANFHFRNLCCSYSLCGTACWKISIQDLIKIKFLCPLIFQLENHLI